MNKIKNIIIISLLLLIIVFCYFTNNLYKKIDSFNYWNKIYCNVETMEDVFNLQEYNKPLILFIGADYCDTCINFKPYIEELYKNYNENVTIKYVDVGENKKIRKEFNIEIIPATIIFDKSGKYYTASEYISLYENAEIVEEKKYQSENTIIIKGDNLGLNTNFDYGQNKDGQIVYTRHTGLIDYTQLKSIVEDLL